MLWRAGSQFPLHFVPNLQKDLRSWLKPTPYLYGLGFGHGAIGV